jgi:hypothetical protein
MGRPSLAPHGRTLGALECMYWVFDRGEPAARPYRLWKKIERGPTFQSAQTSQRYVRSISMLFLALSIEMRLNILLNLFGRHPVD